MQRFGTAEYAHIPDDFPMDRLVINVENHFVISTLSLLNRYFRSKKEAVQAAQEQNGGRGDSRKVVASSKPVLANIPQEFPIEEFSKDVQRNPDVALVYVEWFYRLFNELDESQRKAIEPYLKSFTIHEVTVA